MISANDYFNISKNKQNQKLLQTKVRNETEAKNKVDKSLIHHIVFAYVITAPNIYVGIITSSIK